MWWSRNTELYSPYNEVKKGEKVNSFYIVSETLGTGFTISVNEFEDGRKPELLISVDDPNFDTSQIGCLTPDGAVTVMPDTRINKEK
jgi:hypothetical protein